mmetsp:Transcript_23492/g.93167  ORF Transcript_23492/g.93167 Transcript_23492/m.93167 type:complete len:92 (+) Transcript_23492:359-634(+)
MLRKKVEILKLKVPIRLIVAADALFERSTERCPHRRTAKADSRFIEGNPAKNEEEQLRREDRFLRIRMNKHSAGVQRIEDTLFILDRLSDA